MPRQFGFIGGAYTLDDVSVDAQRCVNLYPQINAMRTGKGNEVASLVSTSGLTLKATLGGGPIRGMFTASNGSLYVASGVGLYRLDSSLVVHSVGTLLSTFGPVRFADNGLSLVAVDGDHGYSVTLSNDAFALITDANFHGANTVAFLDNYLVFNWPNTPKFYFSGLQALTFNALDFASLQSTPDNILALVASHREIWMFKKKSIEVWFDSGDNSQPFQRVLGASIEYGLAAAQTALRLNNSIFWLGADENGNGVVWRSIGYLPVRVSTNAIELALRGYGDLSGATAYGYEDKGHFYYVLNGPTWPTTWVFDASTNLWHERQSAVVPNKFGRHFGETHAYAYATHFVGDYANGNVYTLDPGVYTDNGSIIPRIRSAPHIIQALNRIFYHSFQLDLRTGVGLDGSVQGSDPQAMLRWSDDGGHTYGNEHWTSIGKIGEYRARAKWLRLGSARDRVFQMTITDPVQVILIGAELSASPGVS